MIDNRQSATTVSIREFAFTCLVITALAGIAACTVPNPNYRRPGGDAGSDASSDAGADATSDASPTPSPSPAPPPPPTQPCTANEVLRCDGDNLVRCNAAGTGELSEACAVGCSSRKCLDVSPSNGLAAFLDQSVVQAELNLGDSANINTDNGMVTVDGKVATVESAILVQSGAPTIRVFMVRSLATKKVTVNGTNALAIVSNGDISINDLFDASAHFRSPGAGAFSDGNCSGKTPPLISSVRGGAGGAGFGSPGGRGGSARNSNGFQDGGAGGAITGNAALSPLRGGCHAEGVGGGGKGGGAIQLVSRTKIVVGGKIASNGSNDGSAGSGGGILLEAPLVEVSGLVVANGASAGLPPGSKSQYGCGDGQDGQLDTRPAVGGNGCVLIGSGFGPSFDFTRGANGSGAALNVEATDGSAVDLNVSRSAVGGGGGGGAGRIRINAVPGGIRGAGMFSPAPSNGTLGTR